MKNVFAVSSRSIVGLFVILFTALVNFGCEHQTTSPLLSPGPENEQNGAAQEMHARTAYELPRTDIRGSITLEGILVLPIMFNIYYSIDGQIDYTLEVSAGDPDAQQDNAKLNLSVKAVLTGDVPGEEYYISEETETVLNIPQDDILKLEESFPVQGSIEDLRLVCRFLVSRESVVLDARWLKVGDNDDGDDAPKCILLPRLPDWRSDRFVIEQASIRDDILIFTISYSGGCKLHEFQMVCTTFQESYPLQVSAQIFHNNNDDPCDQWITEERRFDLSPLKELYLSMYDDPCGAIEIDLVDETPQDSKITYQFCRDNDVIPPGPPLPPIHIVPNTF